MQFAELGGFEEIKKQIETAEKVDAPVRSMCEFNLKIYKHVKVLQIIECLSALHHFATFVFDQFVTSYYRCWQLF